MNIPPIFIIGCPRSGTTTLSELISHIPYSETFRGIIISAHLVHRIKFGITEEEYQFYCFEIRKNAESAVRQRRQKRMHLLTKLIKRNISLGEFCISYSRRKKPAGFYKTIRFIYGEPFLALQPSFILDIFPQAKILHIMRDGRASASSLVQTYGVLSEGLISSLQNRTEVFCESNEIGILKSLQGKNVPYWLGAEDLEIFMNSSSFVRAYLFWEFLENSCYIQVNDDSRFSKDNYFKLKYKDFVSHPKEYAGKLNDFLETNIPARRFNVLHRRSLNKYEQFIDKASRKIIDFRYESIIEKLKVDCR